MAFLFDVIGANAEAGDLFPPSRSPTLLLDRLETGRPV